ncbi:MAG: hypothetical protein IT214_13190 [Chitinophagaceae bacterium]|nr:hypothetical protein [Chitinophagaceae bacterium]
MRNLFFSSLLFVSISCLSQENSKVENVILITIDGCRWQEIFNGADSMLLFGKKYGNSDADRLIEKFWDNDLNKRRERLLPFLWNTIAKEGRLYGNRNLGSRFSVRNKIRYSYPGYAEIFTGYVDTSFKTNDLVYNKNTNVFEFLNKQNKFKGKVASFASWDRANGFLNKQRSTFFINAGYDDVNSEDLSFLQKTLNSLQKKYHTTEQARPDYITYLHAKEYVRQHQPKVLSIGFAWTDDMAHDGNYPKYLDKIFFFDNMIQDLWEYIQKLPQYKNKTALFIAVDHGRGLGERWVGHGPDVPPSENHTNETWLAVLVPGMIKTGEVENGPELFNAQIAGTIAKILGYKFETEHPVGLPIADLF